tara:strand:+ start:268 stop:609 length:342 start_codon:yes stop_codon:yes gene_type:complete
MSYNPNDPHGGEGYWNWKPDRKGIAGFGERLWHDSIGALIHGVERLATSHGASPILGPGAKNFTPVAPPALPTLNLPHVSGVATVAPQQTDIQNNFSTANQYQARFGVSQSHF